MKIEKKKEIVKDLHEKFAKSKIVILTDYKGLDVAKMNDLRRKLREERIEYLVVKNTLLIRAAEDTGVTAIKDMFEGPSAVAIGYDDPVSPAKALTKFAKDNKKLEIKIGVLEGKALDFNAIEALSKLPSREALLGQVLYAMNAVPISFMRVLNNIPQGFVNVLTAIRDKKEKEAA